MFCSKKEAIVLHLLTSFNKQLPKYITYNKTGNLILFISHRKKSKLPSRTLVVIYSVH